MEYIESLVLLRQKIIRIMSEFPSDLTRLPPHLFRDRTAAFIGLTDILIKLNSVLGIPEPEDEDYDEHSDGDEQGEAVVHIPVPHPYYVFDDDPPDTSHLN